MSLLGWARRSPRMLRHRPTVLAIALAAAGTVVVGLLAGGPPGTKQQGGPSGGATDLLQIGDQVVGQGGVVAERGGLTRLCYSNVEPRLLGQPEIELSGPLCPQVSVGLSGVNGPTLPGWTQWTNVGFSALVAIRGRWTGDVVDVQQVGPYERRPRLTGIEPTCDPAATPIGQQPPSSLEYESALSRLAATLDAEPQVYAGYWTTSVVTVTGGTDRVVVVGTVGDVKAARDHLAESFPYAVCAAKVDHSRRDLEQVIEELAQTHPEWMSEIRLDLNRVVVLVPVLDETNERLLRAFPAAIASPLIAKVP
jgi:hypothetical protein